MGKLFILVDIIISVIVKGNAIETVNIGERGMDNDLGIRLGFFMERKVPTIGSFIFKKQCMDMGIVPEKITESALPRLADKLSEASALFLGPEESNKLRRQINHGDF